MKLTQYKGIFNETSENTGVIYCLLVSVIEQTGQNLMGLSVFERSQHQVSVFNMDKNLTFSTNKSKYCEPLF